MAANPSAVEQAVSRALRDSLEKIQRSSDELHQAINDLVSACASSRPTNALPPMVRAQSSAASLSASLDVLSRFVTNSLQSAWRSPFEQEISRATSLIAAELASTGVQEVVRPEPVQPEPVQPEVAREHPMEQGSWAAPVPEPVEEMPVAPPMPEVVETPATSYAAPVMDAPPVADIPVAAEPEPVFLSEPVPVFVLEPEPEAQPVFAPEPVREAEPVAPPEHVFSLDSLPPEEQELHRRAYRVAKVSMQDIKMLRPDDVRLGRENKDLCVRLREDIEKAHKEYDRRFQSIQSHPVDYFYDWMVEILAGGDPQALGEYPYPSPVAHR